MNDVTHDSLFDALSYGKMTPEQAEEIAKRSGLPPLAPQPNPDDYNAMLEAWWTLPMTIAWIAWRSHAEVVEVWDSYRLECSDWHFRKWRIGFSGDVHKGYFLERRRPATVPRLVLSENYRRAHGALPSRAISVKEARARLWKALAENLVQATGIRTETRQRVVIEDYEWRDLEYFEERGRDVVRVRDGQAMSTRGYDDLAFRPQNIMRIWQPRRIEERGLYLPETRRPDGPGYMPLYCAAQWIATQGGTVTLEPTDITIWEAVYSELLARISSNEVAVTGMHDGLREKLEGYLFASISVSYPFVDTPFEFIVSNDLYLLSYPYVGEEHWQKGFYDSLQDRRGERWSKILVLKSDVARLWPFTTASVTPESHSGAPGRPSIMHLVEAEYDARRVRGEADGRIAVVAAALADWAKFTYPNLRTPTAGTIANRLRSKHRKPDKTS